MINKKRLRRKTEDSKKESRIQTKKETEGERESRGYAKTERGERLMKESRRQKKKEPEKNRI